MARHIQFSILFVIALFFFSLPIVVNSQGSPGKESFYVEGQVYCDTCRAQFINKFTQFMPGTLLCEYIIIIKCYSCHILYLLGSIINGKPLRHSKYNSVIDRVNESIFVS